MKIITPYRGHAINWSHYRTARSTQEVGIRLDLEPVFDADKAVFWACVVVAIVGFTWGI